MGAICRKRDGMKAFVNGSLFHRKVVACFVNGWAKLHTTSTFQVLQTCSPLLANVWSMLMAMTTSETTCFKKAHPVTRNSPFVCHVVCVV